MSKALTLVNRNDERDVDPVAERLAVGSRKARFPSYFGNFGIFNRLLMLRAAARLSKRRPGKEQEFPLITAFMAIV
jgi:hypothetical protein